MPRPSDLPPAERYMHGTRARYVAGCRCDVCRAANTAAYHERQRRAKELAAEIAAPAAEDGRRPLCPGVQGQPCPKGTRLRKDSKGGVCSSCRELLVWNGLVPAGKARAHLQALSERGIGRRAVSAACDVADSVLSAIISGEKTQIRAETERAILAVDESARADGALVPAGPTWRVLNDLRVDGASKAELAQLLGNKTPALQVGKRQVLARTAHRVARLVRLISPGKEPSMGHVRRAIFEHAKRKWRVLIEDNEVSLHELHLGGLPTSYATGRRQPDGTIRWNAIADDEVGRMAAIELYKLLGTRGAERPRPAPEPAPLGPVEAPAVDAAPIGLRSRPFAQLTEETEDVPRLVSGLAPFDRVLGGGLVPGTLVLLGGDPGVGKSTLLLQALNRLALPAGPDAAQRPVLYVTGEETLPQAAQRARRLGVAAVNLHALAETRLDTILEEARELRPAVLAIDSIQTVQARGAGRPGSLRQVRAAIDRLMAYAKKQGVAVLLIGHVTKTASLAGPKSMEHYVDVVMYFDNSGGSRRSLWASKNRYGSTEVTGAFEMGAAGLAEAAPVSDTEEGPSAPPPGAAPLPVAPANEAAPMSPPISPLGAHIDRLIASRRRAAAR